MMNKLKKSRYEYIWTVLEDVRGVCIYVYELMAVEGRTNHTVAQNI